MYGHNRLVSKRIGQLPAHLGILCFIAIIIAFGVFMCGAPATGAFAATQEGGSPSTVAADEALQGAVDVRTNGLDMRVPASAKGYGRPDPADETELFTISYGTGSSLAITTSRHDWDGDNGTVERYIDRVLEDYALQHEGATLRGAQKSKNASGTTYWVGSTRQNTSYTAVCAVPLHGSQVCVVTFQAKGSVTGQMAEDLAAIVGSMVPAPVSLFEVDTVLGMPGHEIVAALDAEGYLYQDDPEAPYWTAQIEVGELGPVSTRVQLFSDGSQDNSVPYMSLGQLVADSPISGIQVDCLGTYVEWDEPTDAADYIQEEYGLVGEYAEGYTSGLGDDGDFSWARVGKFRSHGRDAYWMISIESDPAGGGRVSISADLLDNGYGDDPLSYDEIKEGLLGSY